MRCSTQVKLVSCVILLVALHCSRASLAQGLRIQIPDTSGSQVAPPLSGSSGAGGLPSAPPRSTAQLGLPFDPWAADPGGSATFGGPPSGGTGNAFPSQTPPVLFPERGGAQPGLFGSSDGMPNFSQWAEPFKFFQPPRFRYAWLFGHAGPRDLDQSEIDVSAGIALRNFLYSQQPILVYPSFSMQLWDGPDQRPGQDLPAQVYGGYLDALWNSDPKYPFGAEVGVRVGVFTDFDTITTDSIRIQGTGLGRINLTPTITIRAGVMYLDRVKVKLLPVGGILYQPSSQLKLDFYFPQPKMAMYMVTLGSYDIWGYLGGEYGGGSWTIRRPFPVPVSDRVDVNDIRVIVGFEWGMDADFKKGQRIGFVEAGWVLDREVIFAAGDSFTLRDTAMIRAGINY